MKISAIAAIGKNNEIGLNNKLIWKISEDLKNFKKITMGHFLVMGRKTYESIGKNLEGRKLIILTSDPYYKAGEHITAQGVDEAIFYAKKHGEDELMICGERKYIVTFIVAVTRCISVMLSLKVKRIHFSHKLIWTNGKLIERNFFHREMMIHLHGLFRC